ncbi:hypothetical protein JXM67_11835 [candidate division WOR-3 bacterium]|nr:hypothetical protein [candidate division WOR-3 bacterium]
MTYFSANEYLALTAAQRRVLDCFTYATEPLTAADIYKKVKKKISLKTIQRALAKLCKRGVLERLAPGMKGRGYSNMYTAAEEKHEEEAGEEAVSEEVKEEAGEEAEEGAIAEINALITKCRKALGDFQ